MKVAREDIFAKAIEYALFAPFVGTPEWKDLLKDEELQFQAKLQNVAKKASLFKAGMN